MYCTDTNVVFLMRFSFLYIKKQKYEFEHFTCWSLLFVNDQQSSRLLLHTRPVKREKQLYVRHMETTGLSVAAGRRRGLWLSAPHAHHLLWPLDGGERTVYDCYHTSGAARTMMSAGLSSQHLSTEWDTSLQSGLPQNTLIMLLPKILLCNMKFRSMNKSFVW